jgi:hypothetical protein
MSNDLIFGVWVVWEFNPRSFRIHFGLDLHRRNYGGQIAHAHQIVGGASKGEDPIHFAHSAMPHLPHQRNRLQPAKAFLDAFPFSLTDGITGMPSGAAINCAAARPCMILRHMGGHSQVHR